MSWSTVATFLLVAHGVAALTALLNQIDLRRVARRRRTPDRWPRLSVLIPARNEEANLARLLPSLTVQDYEDLEIIVYDDASTDRTPDVVRALADDRVRLLEGHGPPQGWIGKPHALYQSARAASGDVLLFLDADAEWLNPAALRRMVLRFCSLPQPAFLTGLPRYRGGGLLLVSLISYLAVIIVPFPMLRRMRWRPLGVLNGQCWMIGAEVYRRHQPHEAFADEVVEDLQIGRWLLSLGVRPWIADLAGDLAVHMYGSLPEAWAGFRKNTYLAFGGHPVPVALAWTWVALVFLVAPIIAPLTLVPMAAVKLATDRQAGLPVWLWVLLPVSWLIALGVVLDSAQSHWRSRVDWKGRNVAR